MSISSPRYVSRFRSGNTEDPEYVREFKAISQKVTDARIVDLKERLLALEILVSSELEDDSSLPETNKDSTRMEPIVKVIMKSLLVNGKMGLTSLRDESKLYSEYILNASGRTGKVLARMLIQKCQDTLCSYISNDNNEPTEYEVFYPVNIIYFLSMLAVNKGGAIPVQVPIRALYMFLGQEFKNVRVFNEAFVRVHPVLKEITLYNQVVKNMFLKNLTEISEKVNGKDRFMAIDNIDYIKTGKLNAAEFKDKNLAITTTS